MWSSTIPLFPGNIFLILPPATWRWVTEGARLWQLGLWHGHVLRLLFGLDASIFHWWWSYLVQKPPAAVRHPAAPRAGGLMWWISSIQWCAAKRFHIKDPFYRTECPAGDLLRSNVILKMIGVQTYLISSHRFIRNVCGGLVWKVIFWFTRCTWRMGCMVEKASCNSRDLPQKLDLWFEYTLNGVLDRRHKARRKASEHSVNSKSRCAGLMIRRLKIIPPRLSRPAVNSSWTEYRFVDVESLCEQASHCSEDRCVGWEGQCSEAIKWGPWAQQQAGERS